VPYAWKKLLAYIVIVVLLFFLHQFFLTLGFSVWANRGVGAAFVLLFIIFILNVEKKDFQRLPFIGKFLRPKMA
jgi:hypothetical protein